MGTRGLMGFATDGVLRAAYNHFDSYPEGLGAQVFEWASDADLEYAKAKVLALEVINEMDEPTPEQVKVLEERGFKPQQVSSGTDFYSWLRDCQGNPAATLGSGFIPDSVSFAKDSLFCEWAYVVDLDARTLEVYKGFQTTAHTEGRFAGGGTDAESTDGYFPVRLILTVPLDGSYTTGSFLEAVNAAE
jgi:hypothetical protein